MTKPSKNYGFVRCDSEFEAVGQDLDMSTMGIVKGIPMYQMPDISRELMLLEEQLKFSAKGKEDKHMLASWNQKMPSLLAVFLIPSNMTPTFLSLAKCLHTIPTRPQ